MIRLAKAHWHLTEADPIPERWGVLLGDVFTNFRATLDHAMWAAVEHHSGRPARPEDVQFPIVREAARMSGPRKRLQSLVSSAVWAAVEEVQPHHLQDPQRHQLETLRWGSNIDKHRFVHVTERAFVDLGPVIVTPDLREIKVVDEWRIPGQAAVGDVVAGLTLRRSAVSQGVDLGATLAHTWVIRVGEAPPAWEPLDVAMEAMKDYVLAVLGNLTTLVGEEPPDPTELELGLEHADIAPEFGGLVLHWQDSPQPD